MSIPQLLDNALPPLKADEERKLLIRAKRGDESAKWRLVQSLIPYGVRLSKRYYGKGMDDDDYAQTAMVGILEAIDTMDLKRGCRLTTHMTWRVRHAMTHAQIHGDLIRTPSNGSAAKGNKPVPKEVESISAYFDRSYEEAPPLEPDSLWFMPLLTPREKLVIQCRFHWKLTLRETGERIRVTRERVRQITAELFRRIRYAEARAANEEHRVRLFRTSRRSRGRLAKARRYHLLSAAQQVAECFKNRGNGN